MISARKPLSLYIAAILMILLGLARGLGGIILLLQGKSTLPEIKTSETVLVFLAAGLILIGTLEIISAIGIFFLKRIYWFMGLVVTLLFVIDGVVNGYFLFGKPGEGGTLINLAAAAVIISFLLIVRAKFPK